MKTQLQLLNQLQQFHKIIQLPEPELAEPAELPIRNQGIAVFAEFALGETSLKRQTPHGVERVFNTRYTFEQLNSCWQNSLFRLWHERHIEISRENKSN